MLKQKPHTGITRSRKAKHRAGNSSSNRVKIKTEEAYDMVMKEIDGLMKKGEKKLNAAELNRLRILAGAAEIFEDDKDPLPLPSTLPELIKMRMFQLKLNQHFISRLLGISEAKLSLIMNGKQKPDVNFLKALHEKLKIDAEQILKAV